MLKLTLLISFLLIGIFLGVVPQAQALQITNYPSFLNIGAISSSTTPLIALIDTLFRFLLMIAGLAALVMIVWGGIGYLTSVGDPSKTGEAKDQIFAAILGLVIMFSSWMILNTINPQLVALKEPGTATATPAAVSAPPVIVGNCAPNTNYSVKLFTKNDPSPVLCFNSGQSKEDISKNIYSVQVETGLAVKFFGERDFHGRNLCFKSSYPNIASCCIGGFNCTDKWPNDVKSVKIISIGECQQPGITLEENGTPASSSAKCDGF